jgi:hypothetical protein
MLPPTQAVVDWGKPSCNERLRPRLSNSPTYIQVAYQAGQTQREFHLGTDSRTLRSLYCNITINVATSATQAIVDWCKPCCNERLRTRLSNSPTYIKVAYQAGQTQRKFHLVMGDSKTWR